MQEQNRNILQSIKSTSYYGVGETYGRDHLVHEGSDAEEDSKAVPQDSEQQNEWTVHRVVMDQHSFRTFRAFLQYLTTGEVYFAPLRSFRRQELNATQFLPPYAIPISPKCLY